ncbi:F-box/kelch-repeat protein At3g23880-like [Apium graveolens]|uniref:F-box/kelch-repeat protein At3g23880-like n=1 Tax=Apium graveolens TaxID=4045 RepID=UPI003D7AFC94
MISDHLRCRRRLPSYSVPEEIAELIIAKVPCIKTIFRCTCVCKSWCAFINSAPFVKSLTSRIATNNNEFNQLLLCKFEFEFGKSFIPNYGNDDCMKAFHDSSYAAAGLRGPNFALHVDGEDFKENCKLVFPRRNVEHIDACNGLICYSTCDDPDCLYLWNPTIQREKKISTPLPNLNNNIIGDYDVVFKLWFDNKVNDLRILRIACTDENCTVEVFSLTSNSWMLIAEDAPVSTAVCNRNTLACVNGIFYWPVLREDGNWILISLDIKNGVFRERLTSWTAEIIYLTPSHHDASLVILGYGDKDDLDKPLDCCVFQVYSYSLDKFHKLDINHAHIFHPLGVRNNDELLLQSIYSLEIVSYSVESGKCWTNLVF